MITAVDDKMGNAPNQSEANDPGAFLRGIMGAMQRGQAAQHGQQQPGQPPFGPPPQGMYNGGANSEGAPKMPCQNFQDPQAWKAWGEQMKQWGNKMSQQCGGPGGRRGGGHGGWGGPPGPMGGWRRWMNQGNQACGNWNGQHQGAWEGHGGHKVNRGKIIKAPEDIIIASPSETVHIQVELRNNTHWPYKPGCQFVGLFNAALKEVLEEVKMPVEQVQAMTNYTLSVPLKIKENAVPCELTENSKEHYEVMFSLQGPKGFAFGETVIAKLRVIKKLENIEIYTRVMQLIESNPDGQFAFEEAVAAYKEAGYDAKRTIQLIKKKREEGAKKVAEESQTLGGNQKDKMMSNDDDSDDIYA